MVAVARRSLAQHNDLLTARTNGLKGALQQWLDAFGQIELQRALRDPHKYAGLRVRKQRDPVLEYLDEHLKKLLLMYGLREAGDAANKSSGKRIITERIFRDAVANKPTNIKWFWELRDGIAQRVKDITDATREEARASVKRIIQASMEEEVKPSVGEVARRIRTAFQGPEVERAHRVHAREGKREFVFSSERAAVIARTELGQAENTGTFTGYQEAGVEEIEWMAMRNDGRSGARAHWKMDGERVKIGEYFTMPSGAKLRHPGDFFGPIGETINCFPGDTVVAAEHPELIYRRWYSGALVTVTTRSGRVLSGTPNHPVLTTKGWVALGSVDEGDDLIDGCVGDVGDATNTEPDLIPTSLSEAFDLLGVAGTRTGVGRDLDFHGDGREADVEIVSVERDFFLRDAASSHQCVADKSLPLPLVHLVGLAPDRSEPQLRLRSLLASDGIVRRGGEFLASNGPLSSHSDLVRFRSTPDANTRPAQSGSDAPARKSKTLRDRQLALTGEVQVGHDAVGDVVTTNAGFNSSPAEVSRHRVLPDAEGLTDFVDRHAFRMKTDRVVDKSVSEWSGHVFNLQTSDGWYLANGLVVHNCRCTLAPVVDTKPERARTKPPEAVRPPDETADIDALMVSQAGAPARAPALTQPRVATTVVDPPKPEPEPKTEVSDTGGTSPPPAISLEPDKPATPEILGSPIKAQDLEEGDAPGPTKHTKPEIARFAEIMAKAEPEDVKAIQEFTGHDYPLIRAMEQTSTFEEADKKVGGRTNPSDYERLKPVVQRLRDVFDRTEPTPGRVFRGIKIDDETVFEAVIGANEHVFAATSSTSWEIGAAHGFAVGSKYGVIFDIRQKSGLAIESISQFAEEREVLMKKGARFRVLRRYRMSGETNLVVIEMEEI